MAKKYVAGSTQIFLRTRMLHTKGMSYVLELTLRPSFITNWALREYKWGSGNEATTIGDVGRRARPSGSDRSRTEPNCAEMQRSIQARAHLLWKLCNKWINLMKELKYDIISIRFCFAIWPSPFSYVRCYVENVAFLFLFTIAIRLWLCFQMHFWNTGFYKFVKF